ncbi:MAG: hypothetical protein C5B47_09010 [Verrucomicrobia bacterium]|nr:MAG: hypothetical protein C5B47_09010 [Verrucomicrobiota bacterium]
MRVREGALLSYRTIFEVLMSIMRETGSPELPVFTQKYLNSISMYPHWCRLVVRLVVLFVNIFMLKAAEKNNAAMPVSSVKLLCTDFDGTLVESSLDRCTQEFAEVLSYQRKRGGSWVINTGRSLPYTLEGLAQFHCPVSPDYIITQEREIYHLSSSGKWQDFGDWNLRCRRLHNELLLKYQDALEAICKGLTHRSEITPVRENGIVSGLVASSEEIMSQVTVELDWACKDLQGWAYQRNNVYLRFCHVDYHKGSALKELCRLIGFPREVVLAAGDNFNDIAMLDGKHAAMCACPANAIKEVKEAVLKADGFVASGNHALGVAESVQYFLER